MNNIQNYGLTNYPTNYQRQAKYNQKPSFKAYNVATGKNALKLNKLKLFTGSVLTSMFTYLGFNRFDKDTNIQGPELKIGYEGFNGFDSQFIHAKAGEKLTNKQTQALRNILDEIRDNPEVKNGKWDDVDKGLNSTTYIKYVTLKDGNTVQYILTEHNGVEGLLDKWKNEKVYLDEQHLNNPIEHITHFNVTRNKNIDYSTNKPYIGNKTKYINVDLRVKNRKMLDKAFNDILAEIESMPEVKNGEWDSTHTYDLKGIPYQQVNYKKIQLKDGSIVAYKQTIDLKKYDEKYKLPKIEHTIVFDTGYCRETGYKCHINKCTTLAYLDNNDNGVKEWRIDY